MNTRSPDVPGTQGAAHAPARQRHRNRRTPGRDRPVVIPRRPRRAGRSHRQQSRTPTPPPRPQPRGRAAGTGCARSTQTACPCSVTLLGLKRGLAANRPRTTRSNNPYDNSCQAPTPNRCQPTATTGRRATGSCRKQWPLDPGRPGCYHLSYRKGVFRFASASTPGSRPMRTTSRRRCIRSGSGWRRSVRRRRAGGSSPMRRTVDRDEARPAWLASGARAWRGRQDRSALVYRVDRLRAARCASWRSLPRSSIVLVSLCVRRRSRSTLVRLRVG